MGLPQSAVARLNAGVRRTLGDVLPELELPGEGRGERSRQNDSARFFEAVGYVVNLATQSHPVIIAIEDVHWASTSTLQLLTYLLRRLAAHPVLLVCSYRPEELPDAPGLVAWLNSLAREPHVQTIPLARLTPADVEAIAGRLELPAPKGENAGAWLYRETEGNPLFIVESLRSLDENADSQPESERTSGNRLARSTTLRASSQPPTGVVSGQPSIVPMLKPDPAHRCRARGAAARHNRADPRGGFGAWAALRHGAGAGCRAQGRRGCIS